MIIGNEILKYKEDIIRTLCELIRIRSVAGEPKEGKPFGEDVNRALEYVLSLGESLGFRVKNVDGYAGHLEFGEGDEIVAVLVHLDVVPEGIGWKFPPFEGVIRDGKIYGRGASDDKGSAVAAMYGLKVLKDLGIVPRRKVRIIFGTNEESGMQDMKYYFEREPVPQMGFSPDASYPIINREKGILQIALVESGFAGNESANGEQWQDEKDLKAECKGRHRNESRYRTKKESSSLLMEIIGGDAVNMIPADCRVYITAGQLQSDEIIRLQELAGKRASDGIEVLAKEDGGVHIRARGKSAHAASPENGINAIYRMLDFLGRVVCLEGLPGFIYRNKIGLDTSGQVLGINFKDEESGALTLSLGKITYNKGEKRAAIDIRYPVTCNYKRIVEILSEKAGKEDVDVEINEHLPPLYVPENHPLIVKLGSAYEKITGKKAGLLSIGGGSYARTLKNNGVAFGGVGTGAHQPDEHVSIEELMMHACICTQAMYEIAT